MKKIFYALFILASSISSAHGETADDIFRENGFCNGGDTLLASGNTVKRGIYGLPVTINCQGGKLSVKCDTDSYTPVASYVPECKGKNGEFIDYDADRLFSRAFDKITDIYVETYEKRMAEKGKAPLSESERNVIREKAQEHIRGKYHDGKYGYKYNYISDSSQTQSDNTKISSVLEQPVSKESSSEEETKSDTPAAGDLLDKTSADKTDTSNQSVNSSGGESTAEPTGSATSGKVAYTGPSSLTAEYYYGCNSGGNIFQQLACRAGQIGLGLRSVGYIIAGFGLLVFSFAALFGKVKWNVFATIMFSVFLLSMTFYVINTFTDDKEFGNSKWIAGVAPTGYDSAEQVYAPTLNVDGVSVPDAENNRPK